MPPGLSMMAGGNPYGPSGPPPPGLASQMPHGPTSSGMYPAGLPPHPRPPSNPLSTVQLQQLSAQIRSYRLLARNLAPPETLLSIAHGRKPTPAMMARAHAQMQQLSRAGAGQPPPPVPTSGTPPYSQAATQEPSSTASQAPSSTAESQNTGSINLYPPSPGASRSQSPDVAHSRATSSPARSQTATTGAPNVTLPPGGELPLAVKQVAAAAAAAASERQSPTPSQLPPSSSSAPQTTQQSSQEKQQQAKPPHPSLKHVKLSPIGKPPGIDPTAIFQERERRYVCLLLYIM